MLCSVDPRIPDLVDQIFKENDPADKVLASWFGDPDVGLDESKQAVLQERSAREKA